MPSHILRAAALATGLLLGAAGPAAHATTIAPLSIEQLTDASTYVVEGVVTDVWTEIRPESGSVFTKARLTVDTWHKGPDRPTELVVTSPGGEVGAYRTNVPASVAWSEGEKVFAFVQKAKDGRWVVPGLFLGKFTKRRLQGTREMIMQRHHPTARWDFDHRFLPPPEPGTERYLNDLREQVGRRVATGWDGQPIPGMTLEALAEANPGSVPTDPELEVSQ